MEIKRRAAFRDAPPTFPHASFFTVRNRMGKRIAKKEKIYIYFSKFSLDAA